MGCFKEIDTGFAKPESILLYRESKSGCIFDGVATGFEGQMKFKVKHYTPGEAAIATGRAVENARNDRREGFDVEVKGQHPRYDALGLSRLYVRQSLADCGVGRQKSQVFLDEISVRIARHLLRERSAWSKAALSSYTPPQVQPPSPERRSPAADLAYRLRKQASEMGVAFNRAFVPGELIDALEIPEDLSGGEILEGIMSGLVIWPGADVEIYQNAWGAFGDLALGDERTMGPAVVMTFFPMARRLARNLPRPLFYLEGED